jgi:hypothetical protein
LKITQVESPNNYRSRYVPPSSPITHDLLGRTSPDPLISKILKKTPLGDSTNRHFIGKSNKEPVKELKTTVTNGTVQYSNQSIIANPSAENLKSSYF